MRLLAMSSMLLLLAGCASNGMSEAECRIADWHAIGFEDGARGAAPDHFGTHRRACAEHGVASDFAAYRAGHTEGIESFCRPVNGARLGESGVQYTGGCPAHLEDAFVAAHGEAYGLYERRSTLRRVRGRLNAKRQRSKAIEHEVVDKTAALVAPDLAAAARASLAVELKQLAEEKVDVEAEIRRLEHEVLHAEEELARYRGALANRAVE